MKSYTIKHHTDEGACQQCGCPLYVGDKVVLNKRDDLFCSRTCSAREKISRDLAGSRGS